MSKILPQGTELFVLAPSEDTPGDFDLLKVPFLVSVDFGEDSRDEHEDTDLDEQDSRTFMAGLNNPGTTTFVVRIDPSSPVHTRLDALNGSQVRMNWVLGWSDGKAPPTEKSSAKGSFELPETRSWNKFSGHITGFNFSGFEAGGGPVQGSISIKRSSRTIWVVKAPAGGTP